MRIFSKCILVHVFVFICFDVLSQKRLLVQLDSSLVDQNQYLVDLNEVEVLGLGNQLIAPDAIDEELAAALIYYKINQWRASKRLEKYREHSKLDRIAYHYSQYYNRYRFRKTQDNYFRLKRTLNKVPKYVILDFTYLEGYTDLPFIVDYEKGVFYYNEDLETSAINLYLGKFSKDEDFVEVAIKQLTYTQFAERVLDNLMKSKAGTLLRSKAYELLTVRVAPTKKRNVKRVIPKAKVIFLLGAYRNKDINQILEKE